jgi:hypothetical protein
MDTLTGMLKGICLGTALTCVSFTGQAALESQSMDSSRPMERMTVNFRAPLDYDIYRYTTLLLAEFQWQLHQEVLLQARGQLQQMEGHFALQLTHANEQATLTSGAYRQAK